MFQSAAAEGADGDPIDLKWQMYPQRKPGDDDAGLKRIEKGGCVEGGYNRKKRRGGKNTQKAATNCWRRRTPLKRWEKTRSRERETLRQKDSSPGLPNDARTRLFYGWHNIRDCVTLTCPPSLYGPIMQPKNPPVEVKGSKVTTRYLLFPPTVLLVTGMRMRLQVTTAPEGARDCCCCCCCFLQQCR